MDATQLGLSSCRCCRNYTPEGRRGGHCSQLNVPVQGNWKPCPLAVPVFLSPLPSLETLPLWTEELVLLEQQSPLPLASELAVLEYSH